MATSEFYGIPFQRSTVLLHCNKTLLEENGFAAPTRMIIIAPLMLAFLFFQRQFINSFLYSGVK